MNVSRWLPDELERAPHGYELPQGNKTVLRVICRQQGVGGYDSWGAEPNEIYKIKTDKPYRLLFKIDF